MQGEATAIVVSEAWPGWLFALKTLNLTCSVLFITSCRRAAFEGLSDGSLKAQSEAELITFHNAGFKTSEVWLFHGAARWLQRILGVCPNVHHGIAAITRGSPPTIQGWSNHVIHSKLTSSVIDGDYHLMSRGLSRKLDAPNGYIRTLETIIDPVDKSMPFTELTEGNGPSMGESALFCEHISDKALLPKSRPLIQVTCNSVFFKLHRVIRRLSVVELGRAYDIPPRVVQQYKHVRPAEAPWLSTVPIKVLVFAGSGLLDLSEQLTPASLPVQTPVDRPWSLGTFDASLPCGHGEFDLSSEALEVWDHQYSKSVKSDNALTPNHLWDDHIWQSVFHQGRDAHYARFHCCALTSLRKALLRVWRRSVLRCFLAYLNATYGQAWWRSDPKPPDLLPDLQAGRDCIHRVGLASWWDWEGGSRLLFWRWPLSQRAAARDGYPMFFQEPPVLYRRHQTSERDEKTRQLVAQKLQVVRNKGYIAKGRVESLTSFFSVPKGDDDIRLVYDASRSGLNKCLWAPNFALPQVDALIRSVNENSWMGDLDIGEMFLNFCLHPEVQRYCGVDLRPFFPQDCLEGKTLWGVWTRCMMGLRPSPYVCIRHCY